MSLPLESLKKLISEQVTDAISQIIWRLANDVDMHIENEGSGRKKVTFSIKKVKPADTPKPPKKKKKEKEEVEEDAAE